ncbi:MULTISPECIES: phosphonate ABC transporter ATP-binding protein [Alcaligenaceae]|uniref:phosphonate ABC transporter ATP-binding protein n=1 Tax=Alcaligenaceae TaxID=506 RepID=UPI0022B312F6|nr:ATP-binding cassette domain-containing protein [Castellaniella sp. S9]
MTTRTVSFRQVQCIANGRVLLEIGSLDIQQGERVALVGHNGAGKSTLLRLLTGFVPAVSGTVDVLGRNLAGKSSNNELLALRREVGHIHQGLHLVDRLSALENALIGSLGRVNGWRSWVRWFPAAEIARAEAALQAVGLPSRTRARADTLSGGERQKVAIARLLVQQPKLILADEPTAALDPAAAAEVCHLLAQAARGAALISVVHSPVLLPLIAERVIGLKQGRVAFDLPAAAVDEATLTNLYRPDEEPARHVRVIQTSPCQQEFCS